MSNSRGKVKDTDIAPVCVTLRYYSKAEFHCEYYRHSLGNVCSSNCMEIGGGYCLLEILRKSSWQKMDAHSWLFPRGVAAAFDHA